MILQENIDPPVPGETLALAPHLPLRESVPAAPGTISPPERGTVTHIDRTWKQPLLSSLEGKGREKIGLAAAAERLANYRAPAG